MSSIVKYACDELGGATISCLIVDGEPYFKGIEVAKVLGYENAKSAVYKHVPLKFKHKFGFLLSKLRVSVADTPSMGDQETQWISEAGLYKLVFKSKLKSAEVFTDWVCTEVLPSIRKTGSYKNDYFYSKPVATRDEVRQLAIEHDREDALHYQVVDHIKKNTLMP